MKASGRADDVGPLRVPPAIDAVNRAFWTGGADGRLMIVRCQACGAWSHPPRERCRRCLSSAVEPEPVSGRGVVATYTINHQQWNPAGHAAPYVIALVELEEQRGLRLLTNIVGCDSEDVQIGMPVQVVFEQYADVWLPLFSPIAPAATAKED